MTLDHTSFGHDHHVCARIQSYAPDILPAARSARIDPYLLAAVAAHESGGNPYAIRVERGFWARYGARIRRMALLTPNKYDDRWLIYPDLASASYGLCQIMYPVALEQGLRLEYPTELLNPTLNLTTAARILGKHLAKVSHDVPAALERYNGDTSGRYAANVIAWRTHLLHTPDVDLTDPVDSTRA